MIPWTASHAVNVASNRLDGHHAWCGKFCTVLDVLHNDLLDELAKAGL